ncbi:putative mediator of RNA polymerase II transcription subunit 26 isoform X3 [Bombyx mandarina]|uniref:Mediator of RNA polymerase II transcription subunit 26 isoform X3 n=1 Tax=Bombyx mandarina TaxID=7092 RepID=A0A6J2KMR9_BOMMA|nr:putative mediator of RNA polymerase II transcription subunit 26 isoform X3 [Bombyx mandarina]
MLCGIRFRRKKGKRQSQHQQSAKSSRSPSPESVTPSASNEVFQPIQRTPTPNRVGPPPSPPVPTQPIVPVAPEPSGPLPLMPCLVCGRTFVPQSLAKHVKICEKMTIKKRKTFDSSRQRREGLMAAVGLNTGTDLEQYLPKNFGLPENSPFLEKSPPPTAKPTLKPKPQSVRSAITKPMAELQKCPHCGRAFGVRAFERHVEWCADKAKILPAAPAHPPPHIADAKQRLNARTQYKAPLARGRKTSQSRDKSSNSRSTSVDSSRGVSPPPPRDCGDYGPARSRASESASSNDCHEDTAPHVPVIRTSRGSRTSSSGDAGVRARQARLARDITSSRLDDGYDPFESAARQMKELMSSESNIPKKTQHSTKALSRTLPALCSTKEKSPPIYLRSDNSKMIKDTLNKTYQKTPTLQRMKSFGSTNNENHNHNNNFSGRCNSFRITRNEKKSNPKLNTTFTKSSKENINVPDKITFNRNSNLNRSFSSYTASSYSTPKCKDKMPKIATSMYHSFQRSTLKQPLKLDRINKNDDKKELVNLDAILTDDNSSMTDSNYIDPRLINENDNLPINVNTILDNPDLVCSMDSLLTTENLPAKFESFSNNVLNNNKLNGIAKSDNKIEKGETNNNSYNTKVAPIIDDLSSQYEKLMSSLEHSIASKTSIRDDDSLCEEFDLEEFISSFDEEIHRHKTENKRTCSSTTRVVKQSEYSNSNKTSEFNSNGSSPKLSNGMIPVNKSMSLNFSSSNMMSENLFPSSVKRSTSLLDSIQKKTGKLDATKSRIKTDQLEQDLMQSLKDFDKFYEFEKNEKPKQSAREIKPSPHLNQKIEKRDHRNKFERKTKKMDVVSNGNYSSNGKTSNDSAYSRLVSLNRISPSKLSICTKDTNGLVSLEQIPAGSDSGGSHKEDARSISSEEFLAMERSTELEDTAPDSRIYKETDAHKLNEKRVCSRNSNTSGRSPSWKPQGQLSSSSSEASLHQARRDSPALAPRLSRFCHECGSKFPVETAKFCIECGVKRLAV